MMTTMLPPYGYPAPHRAPGDEATSNLLSFVDMACSNIKMALDKPVRSKRKVNHRKYLQKQLKRCGGSGKGVAPCSSEGRAGETQTPSSGGAGSASQNQPSTSTQSAPRGAGGSGGGGGHVGLRRENAHRGLQTKSLQALFDPKTLRRRSCADPETPPTAGQKVPLRNRNLPSSFFTEPVSYGPCTDGTKSPSTVSDMSPKEHSLDVFTGSSFSDSPNSTSSTLENLMDQPDFNDILTEVQWDNSTDEQSNSRSSSSAEISHNLDIPFVDNVNTLQTNYNSKCDSTQWTHNRSDINRAFHQGITQQFTPLSISVGEEYNRDTNQPQFHQESNLFGQLDLDSFNQNIYSQQNGMECFQHMAANANGPGMGNKNYGRNSDIMTNCSVNLPNLMTSSTGLTNNAFTQQVSVPPIGSTYGQISEQGLQIPANENADKYFSNDSAINYRLGHQNSYSGETFPVHLGMMSNLPQFPNTHASYPLSETNFGSALWQSPNVQSCNSYI